MAIPPQFIPYIIRAVIILLVISFIIFIIYILTNLNKNSGDKCLFDFQCKEDSKCILTLAGLKCTAGQDGINPVTSENPGHYIALNTKGCSAKAKCPPEYFCRDAFSNCQPVKPPGDKCLVGAHRQCKGESKCILSAIGGAKCSAGRDGVNPSTGDSGDNPGHFMALDTKGCSAVFKCPPEYKCPLLGGKCIDKKDKITVPSSGKPECQDGFISGAGNKYCFEVPSGWELVKPGTGKNRKIKRTCNSYNTDTITGWEDRTGAYTGCKIKGIKRTCTIGKLSHPIGKVSICKDTVDANCPSGYTDSKDITKPGKCYKYDIKDCVKNNGNCVKFPKKPCPWTGYELHEGSCRKKIFKDKICNSGYKRDGGKCKYDKEAECESGYIKQGKHYCCPENTDKFDDVTKLCIIERKKDDKKDIVGQAFTCPPGHTKSVELLNTSEGILKAGKSLLDLTEKCWPPCPAGTKRDKINYSVCVGYLEEEQEQEQEQELE